MGGRTSVFSFISYPGDRLTTTLTSARRANTITLLRVALFTVNLNHQTSIIMLLTFGQYSTLVAAHQRLPHDQLTVQTEFNELMISYYLSGLLANNLIATVDDAVEVHYELTDNGRQCLIEYERQNPELSVTRPLNFA